MIPFHVGQKMYDAGGLFGVVEAISFRRLGCGEWVRVVKIRIPAEVAGEGGERWHFWVDYLPPVGCPCERCTALRWVGP